LKNVQRKSGVRHTTISLCGFYTNRADNTHRLQCKVLKHPALQYTSINRTVSKAARETVCTRKYNKVSSFKQGSHFSGAGFWWEAIQQGHSTRSS